MRIWIIALGVVAVLALVGGYWYGSWESDEVLVKQSADTTSEGIKVHGDWEITVSDPDTGEEMVYAFENALHSLTGNSTLIMLLKGQGIKKTDDDSNQWKLRFTDGEGFSKYVVAETSFLKEPTSPTSFPEVDGLQVIASYIVPPESEQLKSVRTVLAVAPDLIPSLDSSYTSHHRDVTYKSFDVPIPVQPGQEVSATVRISFE